jgi:hypothetical protein
VHRWSDVVYRISCGTAQERGFIQRMRVLFYLLAIVTVTVLRDRESRVADSRSGENRGAKAQLPGNFEVAG